MTDTGAYRHLFSPLRIRNTTLPNRVVFAPVCPTWVAPARGNLYRTGGGLLRGARQDRFGNDHSWWSPHRQEHDLHADGLSRTLERRAARRTGQRGTSGEAARLRAFGAAPASRTAVADAFLENRSGSRSLRIRSLHAGAEPDAGRRNSRRTNAQGAGRARDRIHLAVLRGCRQARHLRRARRRRISHRPRLSAVAVSFALLQSS